MSGMEGSLSGLSSAEHLGRQINSGSPHSSLSHRREPPQLSSPRDRRTPKPLNGRKNPSIQLPPQSSSEEAMTILAPSSWLKKASTKSPSSCSSQRAQTRRSLWWWRISKSCPQSTPPRTSSSTKTPRDRPHSPVTSTLRHQTRRSMSAWPKPQNFLTKPHIQDLRHPKEPQQTPPAAFSLQASRPGSKMWCKILLRRRNSRHKLSPYMLSTTIIPD